MKTSKVTAASATTTGIECEERVAHVKNLLADLMCEYHQMEEDVGNSETGTSSPSVVKTDDFLSSISARVASMRPSSMGFKTELDRYLDEELLDMHTKNFKVLDWWKVAGTRFPTLRKIARDIFAIPVTTVASESAFMGKDNPRVPVTRMGKGMGKNSYLRMYMGKLMGKIFSHG